MINDHNTEQTRKCPACFCVQQKLVGEKNGFQIYVCAECKTLYTSDEGKIPVPFDYADYYTGRDISTPPFVARRLDEIVSTFEPHRQNNRLLDVGCGSGSILEAAQRNNWDAEGVEVSNSAIEYVRANGFKVFHGLLQEAKYPDNYFDVVTAVELFEHLPVPLEVIEEVARILRPGGVFWATTPHGKGASARLLGTSWSTISPPEHIQLFTVKGLRTLMLKSGFSKVKISTQGVNPFEIIHVLKQRRKSLETKADEAQADENGFNRNATAFELNSYLSESKSKMLLKNAVNGVLSLTRLGDSLKVWAQK